MNKKVKKDVSKSKSANIYCSKCGFKIRGKNHEDGDHHTKGKDGKADVSRP